MKRNFILMSLVASLSLPIVTQAFIWKTCVVGFGLIGINLERRNLNSRFLFALLAGTGLGIGAYFNSGDEEGFEFMEDEKKILKMDASHWTSEDFGKHAPILARAYRRYLQSVGTHGAEPVSKNHWVSWQVADFLSRVESNYGIGTGYTYPVQYGNQYGGNPYNPHSAGGYGGGPNYPLLVARQQRLVLVLQQNGVDFSSQNVQGYGSPNWFGLSLEKLSDEQLENVLAYCLVTEIETRSYGSSSPTIANNLGVVSEGQTGATLLARVLDTRMQPKPLPSRFDIRRNEMIDWLHLPRDGKSK
jgi:hypothetical protein